MTGTDLYVNKSHCAAAVRLVYTQISPGHIWTTLYYSHDVINTVSLQHASALKGPSSGSKKDAFQKAKLIKLRVVTRCKIMEVKYNMFTSKFAVNMKM